MLKERFSEEKTLFDSASQILEPVDPIFGSCASLSPSKPAAVYAPFQSLSSGFVGDCPAMICATALAAVPRLLDRLMSC